jgi:hypothetical protein
VSPSKLKNVISVKLPELMSMMKDFMIEKERNKELSNELLFYRKEFDEISKDSVIKVLNLE